MRRSGTARIQYIDRNPLNADQNYNASGVAPHASTIRWSYTVPALRKSIVTSAQCFALRDGATATPGSVLTILQKTSTQLLQCQFISGAINDKDSAFIGSSILLLTGDVLNGRTADVSTGGTISYFVAASITEFDL